MHFNSRNVTSPHLTILAKREGKGKGKGKVSGSNQVEAHSDPLSLSLFYSSCSSGSSFINTSTLLFGLSSFIFSFSSFLFHLISLSFSLSFTLFYICYHSHSLQQQQILYWASIVSFTININSIKPTNQPTNHPRHSFQTHTQTYRKHPIHSSTNPTTSKH